MREQFKKKHGVSRQEWIIQQISKCPLTIKELADEASASQKVISNDIVDIRKSIPDGKVLEVKRGGKGKPATYEIRDKAE